MKILSSLLYVIILVSMPLIIKAKLNYFFHLVRVFERNPSIYAYGENTTGAYIERYEHNGEKDSIIFTLSDQGTGFAF